MANNKIMIPGLNVNIASYGQAAKNRDLAQQQQAYQNLMNMFGKIGEVGADYRNKQYQAAEAEKQRQFQAKQQQENRDAQNAYNLMWKTIEQNKLNAEQKKANDLKLAQLQKDINAKNAEMRMETDPLIKGRLGDELNALNLEYKQITGEDPKVDTSRLDAALKQKEETDMMNRISSDNRRQFESKIPLTLKKKAERDALLTEAAEWFDNGYLTQADYDSIRDRLNGITSTEEKSAEARQSAVATHSGEQTKKSLDDATELERIKAKQSRNEPLTMQERNFLKEHDK